ncbi:MAG: hypothetical protein FJY81_03295, partial [Candidatus Aminicenantes bacterium]|nr:hypothetical protein [Candidatus Aminicenantes bacterium]
MKTSIDGVTVSLENAPCPLCGGSRRRLVAIKFCLPIAACKGCGLVLADPRLPEAELMKRYRSPGFFAEYLASLHAT